MHAPSPIKLGAKITAQITLVCQVDIAFIANIVNQLHVFLREVRVLLELDSIAIVNRL